MSVGVRQLTVLGEFKPHGIVAEALDGKPAPGEDAEAEDRFDYFLFDPDITGDRDESLFEDHAFPTSSSPFNHSDHEIFIRGNRVIWSAGSRIEKRYSSPTSVLMACWCHMESIAEALLCVLQIDSLSIYSSSGEVGSIPLPYSIGAIWSLPLGLLLQKETDGNQPMHVSYSSSSSLLNTRDLSRPNKEFLSSQIASNLFGPYDHAIKGDGVDGASHLILKHPLEEPQVTYVEERGKLAIMKDFDERIIWTSDIIPLMSSYHKGKMKHSIWLLEVAHPESEIVTASRTVEEVLDAPSSKLFSFRRIWQGTCSQCAASEVFMATDVDGVPIICFLLQEQKLLLAVRILVDEMMGDVPVDFRPHTSWTIHAIAAVPVVVTRPRVQVGHLPFHDIVVLTSDNSLLLYSGKQCLCRYVLPCGLGRIAIYNDLKITGVADPVRGRINVIVDNGQMFRCVLRRNPSSSLANDCITAMAEGLHSSFYNYFVISLWGDGDSSYLSRTDSHFDLEWGSLKNVLIGICQKCGSGFQNAPLESYDTSWNFLINSKFHKNYHQRSSFTGLSFSTIHNTGVFEPSAGCIKAGEHQETSFYSQLLMGALDALHALYECLKLDNLRKHDLTLLVDLLCYIAISLGETSYVDHYIRDFPCVTPDIATAHVSPSPRSPPCLLRWLEKCLQYGCKSEHVNDLPDMVCKDKCSAVSWARKIVAFFSLLLGAERNERKLSSGVYCDIANGSAITPEELTVLAMVAERFGLQHLDLLPAGVSLPLRHALDKCRESPPTDWPAAAYVLIGREDLAMGCLGFSRKLNELESRTYLNLISICTPYVLPLKPVTIPSSVCDLMQSDYMKIEEIGSLDDPFEDGMEHMINSSTKLRYGRDLRLNEVRRLLCSSRPVAIQTPVNPSASDQELQQHQLWNLAQRTSALPFGRGAFTLATTHTLLTEALVVPRLVFSGRLPAQQNATVNLDPNVRNISELGSWPEFHNGVAAGLRLAPFQGKMSRTWIQYNKPEEPSAIHAGVLLALGLHGHLRVLTITDVYRYLSQMLYLHIPSRHPSSFPELELPTLLQSAALLAVGLLYEGSAHPLTMKILLGEIGRRSGGDNVPEREGYAVAAGSALGLVALGRGKDAPGFMESFIDRLFQYIGCKEGHNKQCLIKDTIDEHNRNVMDGSQINIDVTAPGATLALALIFLKTECETIASRLSIPATHFDLQYVRPDFIMLRIIARNLIMWNSVQPSRDWIESQIPEITAGNGFDAEALVQAYVNIVAGACVSLGLKFAGSRNGDAQELLYGYAVYVLNEIKSVSGKMSNSLPKGLSEFVSRGTLETCLHLIVLSLSVVMAGSGHLQTFRLLRFLRSRGSVDGHVNYGIQMAVSLSIGFLFLGGGMQTFSTANSAIAALLDYLAFRHLYAIAAESRWVQTVDVDTGLPVYAPLEVTVTETQNFAETSLCEVTPCILPERAVLKTVRVCGPRYWPQKNPFSGGILYIKRKVGVCSYIDDPTGCQSLLSRAIHKVSAVPCQSSPDGTVCDGSKPTEFKVDQSDADFQDFCSEVLLECVSKDRPALLQVYLSFYIFIGSMWEQVKFGYLHFNDSIFLSSLKIAIAYNDAFVRGRLTSREGRSCNRCSSNRLGGSQPCWLLGGKWPHEQGDKTAAILLSWYLQWFGIPHPHLVKSALVKVKPETMRSSAVPLLSMLLPRTRSSALSEIHKMLRRVGRNNGRIRTSPPCTAGASPHRKPSCP
ncbi:unnamed protein product [Spirodela intermedia]|uniref:Uncharacterized protein n=1 Tax=Spirodela intermedia TaxID=51605 RepID=A0A7I8ICH0_SPIIN|nr:unnamed protein product [Spirodela intermedia]CAA6654742.1 unnamed protein product [Spirodela intermedia]